MNIDELIQRKPDEKVIFFLREHPVVFLSTVLLIVILALIPVAGWFGVQALAPDLLAGQVSAPALGLLASAYYLVLWLFFLTSFVNYYLEAWIVTDDRIVNIVQKGLFSRTVSEMDLAKIQDVTSEVKGFVPYLFNYGNVFIQTAAEAERFDFQNVHRPHEIRKQLLELAEADRKKQGEIKPPEP